MSSKAERISELTELLESGAISQDEFDVLKKEIILGIDGARKLDVEDERSRSNSGDKNLAANRRKVLLKPFRTPEGRVKPPEISFLDFSNISDSEEGELKFFLAQKQLHAPHEMTQDEIEIGDKLFTITEIERINSKREGFNFPLMSLGAVAAAVFPIFLINVSPCLMYFGGSSSCLISVICAFSVLNNSSSTKYDKNAAAISLLVVVFAFVYFGVKWKSIWR